MYQYTVIVGNVGQDPEIRYTPDGQAVCNFSVAVSRRWTKGGERKEKTTWFKIACWGKLAETVNQYVTKGRQVMVAGEVGASAYLGKDGEARASLELTARDVKFLGRGENAPDGGSGEHDIADIPF